MICVERVERHTSVSGVRGPVFDGRRGRAKAAARMAILSFDRRVRPGSHAHRAVGTCTRPEIVCCVGGASGGRRRARGQGGRSKDGPCSCTLPGCAPGPAPCARVACVGRYGMRYFYVAPGIRPFNDPTRPAPHRSPLRSRRRSRRRKRETETRRGTSYYDVRAARDGRCGLPSAEARPPARASWRKATREIRSYIHTNWAVAYREARTKPFRGTPPATPVASRGVAGAARLAALRRAMAGPTARARANAICATMPSCA